MVSVSSVTKTPGGWGRYGEKEASSSSVKQLRENISGFIGKSFKFLNSGHFYLKEEKILMCTDSKK